MKKSSTNKTEEVIDNVDETLAKENPKTDNASETKIGTLLKEMRTKQGKTFAEISQSLCIRKAYLEAIENGDYNNIPEYPYGIGFIRSYADYLGLDGNQIVQMYKNEAEADFRKKHPYYVMEPQAEATMPNKNYIIFSIILLVIIYVAWSLFNQFSENNKEETTETNQENVVVPAENEFPLKIEDYSSNVQEEVVAEEPVQEKNIQEEQVDLKAQKQEDTLKSTKPQEEKLPVIDLTSETNKDSQIMVTEQSFVETNNAEETSEEKKQENKTSNKSNLTINFVKDTWIEVRNDQTLYISKVLKAGESYTLPQGTNLRLSVGKAEGVEIMYNGKKAYEVSPNKKMNISVDEIIANAQN